jgi:hypothetical protein
MSKDTPLIRKFRVTLCFALLPGTISHTLGLDHPLLRRMLKAIFRLNSTNGSRGGSLKAVVQMNQKWNANVLYRLEFLLQYAVTPYPHRPSFVSQALR